MYCKIYNIKHDINDVMKIVYLLQLQLPIYFYTIQEIKIDKKIESLKAHSYICFQIMLVERFNEKKLLIMICNYTLNIMK